MCLSPLPSFIHSIGCLISALLFVQGVFINPAFIEPFGLTLIEVIRLSYKLLLSVVDFNIC